MRSPLTLTTARSIATGGVQIAPQLLAATVAAAALLALLLPLPALLVDLLLALSLGAAAGLLVVALATADPLELTSIPPLLVLAGLARIVLCLSVGRLILIGGEAGTLVPTLGSASSGGDAITGFGVLVILGVVQIVMITSGVGRMAEVAARFALDAMPGKQMGIDTAVGAGQMSARDAQAEVRRLEREANFYGAMDGAGRLLRGEAVATIAIVVLTAVAAMTRGVTADGALIGAAAHYVMLATGQGLVTLLPALIMSAAAAVMVSRSTGARSLAEEVGSQVFIGPWPLIAGAIALIGLGLFPGVAKLPTLLGGAVLVVAAWWASRLSASEPTGSPGPTAAQQRASALTVELGMGLLDLLEGPESLMALLPELRHGASEELGFELPPVVVRDSLGLGATEYTVVFRAAVLARGRVRPGRTLAVAPRAGATPDMGAPAELPDGRDGVWVDREEAEELAEIGLLLMTPREALIEHLALAINTHAADLFDLERAATLLAQLRQTHPALVAAAETAGLDAALLRRVCAELLRGGIPLRDPVTIVEAVTEALPELRDPEQLALRVRPRLAGMISDYLAVDGRIRAVALSPPLQEELADAACHDEYRTVAAMMPQRSAAWIALLDQVGAEHGWGRPLAVIAEPGSLLPLQSLCRRCAGRMVAVRAIDLSQQVELEYVVRLEPDQLA
ncbi:MAG: FHIPEP family type III secretion protein [Armatimonadota bacterium]|jgi:flagellar biosynthesis protein FlhA